MPIMSELCHKWERFESMKSSVIKWVDMMNYKMYTQILNDKNANLQLP